MIEQLKQWIEESINKKITGISYIGKNVIVFTKDNIYEIKGKHIGYGFKDPVKYGTVIFHA